MRSVLNGKGDDPSRPVLVTGGAGFIGSNLAARLAHSGQRVIIFDSLDRAGVQHNLAWLRRSFGDLILPVIADVRDRAMVTSAVSEARAVFHFAAQVAVTTSLVSPVEDHDVNVVGTLNVLEAARWCGRNVPVIFASTNKVYGDLQDLELVATDTRYRPRDRIISAAGVSEQQPLGFHTPYGCSKGAADQYVLDYARSFGVPTAVMRMSCIYGSRQFGTEDQGWVAHFLIRALNEEPITIYGDGRQVRDILYVDDAVAAYISAWRNIDRCAGHVFNLGGGPGNAVSLLDVLVEIGNLTGGAPDISFAPWREGDQRYYVSDVSRVRDVLQLPPFIDWRDGLGRLHGWLTQGQRVRVGDKGRASTVESRAAR